MASCPQMVLYQEDDVFREQVKRLRSRMTAPPLPRQHAIVSRDLGRSGVHRRGHPRADAGSPGSGKKSKSAPSFPSVSDMGASSKGGVGSQPNVHGDQDVHLTCLVYASKGSVYSSDFDEGQLLVVLTECVARPSPLFNQKKLVEVYGSSQKDAEDPPPATLPEVATRFGAEFGFVGKKTEDVDRMPWKRNASGWYVSGSQLKEFLMYYDDVLDFRFRLQTEDFESVEEQKILAHIPQESSFDFDGSQVPADPVGARLVLRIPW